MNRVIFTERTQWGKIEYYEDGTKKMIKKPVNPDTILQSIKRNEKSTQQWRNRIRVTATEYLYQQ